MIVRHFKQGDDLVPFAQDMQKGEIRSGVDNIMVAVDEGRVAGVLISRPVCLVHGLWLNPNVKTFRIKGEIVNRLIDFGLGWLSANGCKDAVLLTHKDNQVIRNVVHDRGGYDEQPGVITYLEVL